ncbi:MAG: hypothetical protein IJL93_08925 [Bacteroidales bacterium]|nr:hypothetical protein [Bacteroidales bacterium]
MKRIAIILSAFALLLCACSPKVSGNASSESIPAVHPDYAVVYLYRTGNYVRTPYDVHLGDDVVYRSRNKTKAIVKIDKPGTYEIWGKTETRESITLKVELGKEYYVKTFVHMGAAIWRPSIELVSPEVGRSEWNSIR